MNSMSAPEHNVTCQHCGERFHSENTDLAKCPKCGRMLALFPAPKDRVTQAAPVSPRQISEKFCAIEVIGFIKAVLQNCEVTPAAEQRVAEIIGEYNQELIDAAEQLLAWQPQCSRGSSGDLRQIRLRKALDSVTLTPSSKDKV